MNCTLAKVKTKTKKEAAADQVPVAHICNPSYLGAPEIWRVEVQDQPRQIVHKTPSPK
jgi:hypothetical protein